MYFPDRKPLIRSILLFGSTFGIMTYSLLTTLWYKINQPGESAASRMMFNLVICFSLHTIIGSLLISTPTTAFVKKADKRALQFSLLNTYESEDEPRKPQPQFYPNIYQPIDRTQQLITPFSDLSSDMQEACKRQEDKKAKKLSRALWSR